MVPGGLPGASLGMAGRLPGHPMTGAVLLVSNLDEEVGVRFGCFIHLLSLQVLIPSSASHASALSCHQDNAEASNAVNHVLANVPRPSA